MIVPSDRCPVAAIVAQALVIEGTHTIYHALYDIDIHIPTKNAGPATHSPLPLCAVPFRLLEGLAMVLTLKIELTSLDAKRGKHGRSAEI